MGFELGGSHAQPTYPASWTNTFDTFQIGLRRVAFIKELATVNNKFEFVVRRRTQGSRARQHDNSLPFIPILFCGFTNVFQVFGLFSMKLGSFVHFLTP